MADYGLQRVLKIRGYDITTGELKMELTKLQESTFENNQETAYLTNGNGTPVASFDHTKTAMISGANTRVSEDLLVAQTGQDKTVLTDTTDIEYKDILTLASDTATGFASAVGTLNNEVKFAYVLDVNGYRIETLTQAVAASATEFAYVTGTKVFTFDTGAYPDGTKVEVIYFPTTSTADKFTSFSETFSATYRIVCDALFKDVCNDQIVNGQIVAEKGHVMGEFSWNLSEGSDPTIHNFSVEFLEDCTDEKLWDIFIYSTSNMS
jgi:hypothetical protein